MSSPSSHVYETVYILRPGTSDSDAATIHQKVDNVITKFQGKVRHRDDWGNIPLAYPIHEEGNGRFNIVVYDGQGGIVEEIERHFKILENVMRYLTVAVPEDYDYAKAKKAITASEEEVKKNREMRKKGQGYAG